MSLPPPYAAADDASLVAGCLDGDDGALRTLLERHGALAEVALLLGLDGETDPAREVEQRHLELARSLAPPSGGALLGYAATSCSLRSYLAVLGHRVARAAGLRRPFVAPDVRAPSEHVARVTELLDRQPPDVVALVRLRAHGLERAHAAALLGTLDATARTVLSRLASRLAEADVGSEEASASGWRMVLDAASYAERVEIALATEREPASVVVSLPAARARVELAFRAQRDRLLETPALEGPGCLDTRSIAGFVDGTMRGSARARAEGHVLACPRCLDDVAALAIDTRALEAIRHAASGDSRLALAAALLASGRYELAARMSIADPPLPGARADLVARVTHAARSLDAGPVLRVHEASGVLMRGLPSDEEAPVAAFEALAADDPARAYRALDDTTARSSIGMRLRMLTAAVTSDLSAVRTLAGEARGGVDPGAIADAESLDAIPEGAALPREILLERLRDVVPALVRAALSIR